MNNIKTYEEFDFRNIFKKKEIKDPSEYDKSVTQRMDLVLKRSIEECFIDLQNDGFFVYVTYNPKSVKNANYEVQIFKDRLYPSKLYFSGAKDFSATGKFHIDRITETLLYAIPYLKDEFGLKVLNMVADEYVPETKDKKEIFANNIKQLLVLDEVLSLRIYFRKTK